MPDPVLIVTAMGVALAVSAVFLGLSAGAGGQAGPPRLTPGGSWASGSGSSWAAGCWASGLTGRRVTTRTDCSLWCFRPCGGRIAGGFPQGPRWLVWPLRLALVAGGARVLLHGTSYITDLAGPGTSEWSPPLAWLIFGGLAVLEGAVWALLSLLARRAPGPSLPVCLAVASAGAAVTVMLSGYATGGQVGLPLAAAIIGATAAMLVLTRTSRGTGPLGVPIIGLFSLLVIGRFFGELTSAHAIVLFCAPVAGLADRAALRTPAAGLGTRTGPRGPGRGPGLGRVLFMPRRKFVHDFQSPSGRGPTSLRYKIT